MNEGFKLRVHIFNHDPLLKVLRVKRAGVPQGEPVEGEEQKSEERDLGNSGLQKVSGERRIPRRE